MPRGRPRKTDPVKALEAAMTVFWKKGFDGTSMMDLTEATGMAKPGLYSNFGDKEALFEKALNHYCTELGQPILDELQASPLPIAESLRVFLNKVADSVIDTNRPGGCFVTNSMVECTHLPAGLATASQKADALRRDAVFARFKRAVSEGEVPADKADSLAEFFSGQALAMGVLARGGACRETLQSFVDVALSVLEP